MRFVNRAFHELRDFWAVAIAQLTAVAAFLLGAPLWQCVLVAVLVLVVRVAAGMLLPGSPVIPPRTTLSQREADIANLVADGLNADEIARGVRSNVSAIRKTRRSIYDRLGYRHPWELREWLIEVGYRRPEPRRSRVRETIDSTPVRATLVAASFIGFSWTLFQIWKSVACAGVQGIWAGLGCPS